MSHKKLLAEERREAIVRWLKEERVPMKGGEIARRAGVSRQVIVQDMSILKAKEEPILATAQGYMYMATFESQQVQQLVAVQHTPSETAEELYVFVDHGLTVVNVVIEHEVYGELTGGIHVSNRQEVDAFCEHVRTSNSALLSELTDGVHVHLVEAMSEEQIERACVVLRKKGFLVE